MSNLFDYLAWRGDLTFRQSPPNPVDYLIFCCLSYLEFAGIVPSDAQSLSLADAASAYFSLPPEQRHARVAEDQELLAAMQKSRRFSSLRLSHYVNEIDAAAQSQFSALTVLTEEDAIVIYRGTDSTLVGWIEDFNMSFMTQVPAQTRAVTYLTEAAEQVSGSLSIAGHSKGGNLAVYAAAHCAPPLQQRIQAVYNNDGPGFTAAVIGNPGYRAIVGIIKTFVPQSSFVGLLLEHEEPYTVIHSTQTGIMQHDPYSWEVMGTDFIRLESVTKSSRFFDQTLKTWLAHMDAAQRSRLIGVVCQLLQATNAERVDQLTSEWLRNAGLMLRSFASLDKETRQQIFQMLSRLVLAARQNLYHVAPKPFQRFRPASSAGPDASPPAQLPPSQDADDREQF